jgi:hypothetical protein
MKNYLVLLFIIPSLCFGQRVKLEILRNSSDSANIYTLTVFNDTTVAIGIHCSGTLVDFSENSIQDLAVGPWSESEKIIYYTLSKSKQDAQYSDMRAYQILLLAPKTYFITKINLTDFKKFENPKFMLFYIPVTDKNQLVRFSNREPLTVPIIYDLLDFKSIYCEIPSR